MKHPRRVHGARPPLHGQQRGLAMIEVLVSMLIIALWLLASAGMQAGMFKLQKSADSRLKAIALATELGERMEANSAEAKAGKYALAAGASISAPTDCAQQACTTANLAKYDLKQWSDRVASTLTVDEVTVTRDTTAVLPTYTIRIAWKEPRGRQTYGTAGTEEIASYVMVKVLA